MKAKVYRFLEGAFKEGGWGEKMENGMMIVSCTAVFIVLIFALIKALLHPAFMFGG